MSLPVEDVSASVPTLHLALLNQEETLSSMSLRGGTTKQSHRWLNQFS